MIAAATYEQWIQENALGILGVLAILVLVAVVVRWWWIGPICNRLDRLIEQGEKAQRAERREAKADVWRGPQP